MIIEPPGKNPTTPSPLQPRYVGQGRGKARARRPGWSRRRRRPYGRALIVLPILIGLGVWLGERDWSFAPEEVASGAVEVVDGDSLRMGGVEIRIADIDAPELRQFCRHDGIDRRCGVEARSALARLVEGAEIRCVVRERDRFGRSVARCEAGDVDLGAEMVAAGHAVAFGAYEAQEARARESRRGIWAGEFERPADWRRAQEDFERVAD